MKKYKLIDNVLGWMVFVVAAVTYLLTIEPTASFWDCPEFISQGFKLEVGHPPGNPIFMLAARFAINFTSDPAMASVAVNSMSAILSALTILLLFWSITHLTRNLVVRDGNIESLSLSKYLVIFGSGLCGALAYTWSDTFWFSAVEAEVYAFSSFCTALVFWLILKWEDVADEPHSDRFLVLIAYVIGVSIAVHLLNLLCIPAIVLVFYYKKFKNVNVKGSLIALALSFLIIALILFGLVPGFVRVSMFFERMAVNTMGLPFNTGVLIYAFLDLVIFSWCIYELYRQKSALNIKISFFLTVVFSGMLFIGKSWWLPILLVGGLAFYLFYYCKRIPTRVLSIVALSIAVIFIGYSSYALIIIRSTANTPIDQNSPDNVFSLSGYLNREQYGKTPLLYGQTFNSGIVYQENNEGVMRPVKTKGTPIYAKEVKNNPSDPDRYIENGTDDDYVMTPELNMLFPRIHSGAHAREYKEWIGLQGTQVQATTQLDREGNVIKTETKIKPTFVENLQFFIDYQLNYMYWRYFMWNFVGRQNDIAGSGEITHGNWISGISFIDNPRLGDQSLLPYDLGEGNKGHNVFYMLPLILGIIGLLWQAYAGEKGIQQFWVVFFLFFMTGIAIVLYLNQTPSQPRERDYAFAGSFYAFAIWIGMGVAGLWKFIMFLVNKKQTKGTKHNSELPVEDGVSDGTQKVAAIAAAIVGLIVPLQMVSQTWDDHDRSGRYPARDFGMNYLSSLDENAIIFVNGDNDTFPLWYCQEVEGYRTDVRVVNLSYLSTDWYIEQMRYPAYNSAPVPMQAKAQTYAYDRRQYGYFIDPSEQKVPMTNAIADYYSDNANKNPYGLYEFKYPNMYIPVDSAVVAKQHIVSDEQLSFVGSAINCDLFTNERILQEGGLTSAGVMTFDILSSSIREGWKRPVYFAMTVPDSYYLGLDPYLQNTGMAYQVTPVFSNAPDSGDVSCDSEKMYDNVMNKFRWAGIDKAVPGSLYLDETIRRMVTTTRTSLNSLVRTFIAEGVAAKKDNNEKLAQDKFNKARNVLNLILTKLPAKASPFSIQEGQEIANSFYYLSEYDGSNKDDKATALRITKEEILHYGSYIKFYQSLSAGQQSRLTRIDRYIDQVYVFELLNDYVNMGGDGEAIIEELIKTGVNRQRLGAMLQNYTRSFEQGDEEEGGYAPADSAAAVAAADSINL